MMGMRSCKEVARLMSPGVTLTFFQRFELMVHMSMCGMCRRFEKQIQAVEKKLHYIHTKRKIDEKHVQALEDEIIRKISGPKL